MPADPAAAVTASPHFAGAAAGLGAAEARRRHITTAEAEQIVRAEIADRQAAAADYDQAGRGGQADRLRREASILRSALDASQH